MPARQRSPAARQAAPAAQSDASDAASALDLLLRGDSPSPAAKPARAASISTTLPRPARQRSPMSRPAASTLPRTQTASAAAKAQAEKLAQEKAAAEQAAQAERDAQRQLQSEEAAAPSQVQEVVGGRATVVTSPENMDNRGRTVSKPPAGTPRSRSLSPSSRSHSNFTTGDLDVAHRGSFAGPSYPKSHDDSDANPHIRRMATAPFMAPPPPSTPPPPSSANNNLTVTPTPPDNYTSLSTLSSTASPQPCASPRRPSLQRVRSPSPAPGSSAGVIVTLREQVISLTAEVNRLGKEDAGKRILELEAQVKKLAEENGQLRQENSNLANENSKYFFESQANKTDLTSLRADNAALKNLLQAHNIPLPTLSNISPRTPRTPRSPFSAAFATTNPLQDDKFDLTTPIVAASVMQSH